MIDDTLCGMNVPYQSYRTIREKDGVGVYRILRDGLPPAVLKTFAHEGDRREIANYRILQSLGIPTLPVLASANDAILLPDVAASPILRLGCGEDVDDSAVCAALGRWYRLLHGCGRAYVRENGAGLYAETDCLTRENMEFAMRRTNTEDAAVWPAVFERLDLLRRLIAGTAQTLTYNDFDFTNMVVARDLSEAWMFDYNLLGRGMAASDVRNVTWSLGENGKSAFLAAYGGVDAPESRIDDAASVLVTLYFASRRAVFPRHAADAVKSVTDGRLRTALERLKEAAPCRSASKSSPIC